jgi:hypothetical protein
MELVKCRGKSRSPGRAGPGSCTSARAMPGVCGFGSAAAVPRREDGEARRRVGKRLPRIRRRAGVVRLAAVPSSAITLHCRERSGCGGLGAAGPGIRRKAARVPALGALNCHPGAMPREPADHQGVPPFVVNGPEETAGVPRRGDRRGCGRRSGGRGQGSAADRVGHPGAGLLLLGVDLPYGSSTRRRRPATPARRNPAATWPAWYCSARRSPAWSPWEWCCSEPAAPAGT